MDNNLKYAILEGLKREKLFSFDKEAFFEKHLKKKYKDSASYNYDAYEPIENYFLDIDLNKYSLNAINNLTWTSYTSIIFDIWGQYDGEDDYFNIQSLNGIEICPNIETIHIEYVWSVKDLSPLSKLKKLKEITVFSGKIEIESLAPLLELPDLKKIHFEGFLFQNQQETDEIIKELKKRDVIVKIIS